MPFTKEVKPLTPEQIQDRKRIESIWRIVKGYDHNVELAASPEDWELYERLLKAK